MSNQKKNEKVSMWISIAILALAGLASPVAMADGGGSGSGEHDQRRPDPVQFQFDKEKLAQGRAMIRQMEMNERSINQETDSDVRQELAKRQLELGRRWTKFSDENLAIARYLKPNFNMKSGKELLAELRSIDDVLAATKNPEERAKLSDRYNKVHVAADALVAANMDAGFGQGDVNAVYPVADSAR